MSRPSQAIAPYSLANPDCYDAVSVDITCPAILPQAAGVVGQPSQPIEPHTLASPDRMTVSVGQDADVVGQPSQPIEPRTLAHPELVAVPVRIACPDIFVPMSGDQKPSNHSILSYSIKIFLCPSLLSDGQWEYQ